MNQKPSFGQFPSVNPVSTHSFHSLESCDLNLTLVVCQYPQSLEPLHSESSSLKDQPKINIMSH